jgi:ribonuclease HI
LLLLRPETNEIIPDEWMTVGAPVDPSDDNAWARIIADSLQTHGFMKHRLRKNGRRGTPRDGEQLARRYFLSEVARVAALHSALRHRRIEIGHHCFWTHRRVVELGRALNVFSDVHGSIRVGEVEKKDGSPRIVYSLDVRDLARHRMAALACEAVTDFHPRQFAVHGGDRAMKQWLRAALPGAQLVLTTDFPDFFLSLVRERLTEVTPLPRRVTRALLISPFESLSKPGNQAPKGKEEMQAPKRWASKASRMNSLWLPVLSGAMPISGTCVGGLTEFGVPPGSPFSGIVSQVVLRSILEAIEHAAEGVEAGLVFDNLIIVLRDASAKQAVIHALMEAVRDVISDDAKAELRQRLVPRSPKRFNYVGYDVVLHRGRVKFTSRRKEWDLLEDRIFGDMTNEYIEVDQAYVCNKIAAHAERYEGDQRALRQAVALSFRMGALLGPNDKTDDTMVTRQGEMARATIYTDGSARGGWGPGAWAWVCEQDGKTEERTGQLPLTNNSEVELIAVVAALIACPAQRITLYSDAKYVVENARHHLADWKKNGWRCTSGKPIANKRLWTKLEAMMTVREIDLRWIRSHSGHPGNERAHTLATVALKKLCSGSGC